MNSEHLVEYLELVKRMNFTSTAKYLNITQSALSKHISALEKEFGATFFTRDASGIELTKQGRTFGMQAHRMMNLYQETKDLLAETSTEVRIGGSIGDDAITRIISEAKLALRDTPFASSITVDHQGDKDPILSLKTGKIDLLITVKTTNDNPSQEYASIAADATLKTTTLATIPLVVVMQTTHPLANKTALCAQDLAGYTIVYPICNIEFAAGAIAIDEYLFRHKVNTKKELTYADTITDLAQTCTGDNLLVTPRSNVSRRLFPATMGEITTRPLTDSDAIFSYDITWRKDETAEAVHTVLKHLLRISENINPTQSNE